MEFTSL